MVTNGFKEEGVGRMVYVRVKQRHYIHHQSVMFWTVETFNSWEESDLSFYAFVKFLASLWKARDRKGKVVCPLCRHTFNRMIKSQEDDELITVRVQDPRVQNGRSWNSYVDFKIFLHTNSKAFTAKTSCVRRRYSEFAWLKKKLQKNAGLVPVPDLPPKSLFSFINDDFIERRRKGLQSFLDKVVHMTVCLSDSQLHLFLQTQLPVRHIEDCVQGHTPYTVTEAILNYASSNRGWVQEEEGGAQEMWPAPVLYESVESPAPHVPSLQRSSGPEPPNEHADVSELGEETEHKELHEEERSIHLVVHEDLQGDGSKSLISQMDGPVEVKMGLKGPDKVVDEEMSDGGNVEKTTSVIEKKSQGGTNEGQQKKGRQEAALEQQLTVRQTPPDRDVPDEYPVAQVQDNEVTLDFGSAQEEDAEQSDHRGQEPLETADEAVTLLEGTSISEENLSEDQEQAEAKTNNQENEVCDEDFSTEADIHEDVVEEDHVGEVNTINAKSVHASNAILKLLEASETEEKVGTETSDHDRNLNSNTAGVNTLVLEAIEIDSV